MMDGHEGGSGNMNEWNHQWSNTCSNGSESCSCTH
jgi:hypothetical protein